MRVQAARFLVHEEGQRIHVRRLQLGELAVCKDLLGNRILFGQDLQHVDIRRETRLGLPHGHELAPGEEDFLELLRGVDVEGLPHSA